MPEIEFPGNDIILSEFILFHALKDFIDMYKISVIFTPIKPSPCNYSDLFENRNTGIFSLLDDECKMRDPKLENFMQNFKSMHSSCPACSFFPSICSKYPQSTQNEFLIQHFARKVYYNSVRNFINNFFCIMHKLFGHTLLLSNKEFSLGKFHRK